MMICAFCPAGDQVFSFPSTPQLHHVNARRKVFLFSLSLFFESQFRVWLVNDTPETADNEPKTYIFSLDITTWYTMRRYKWLFESTNMSYHRYGDGIYQRGWFEPYWKVCQPSLFFMYIYISYIMSEGVHVLISHWWEFFSNCSEVGIRSPKSRKFTNYFLVGNS